MLYRFEIKNLACAHCANKIELALNQQDYIEKATLNFVLKRLEIESNIEINTLQRKIAEIATSIEKGVEFEAEDCSATCCQACGGHQHQHVEHKSYEKWITLGGVALFAVALLTAQPLLYLGAYLCIGYDVLLMAGKNLLKGKMLDENFLMSIATIAAFVLGEYPEGVAVMLFYKLGEYVQGKAVNYSRGEIAKAMDIRPEFARIIVGNDEKNVTPQEVQVGDIIEVRAGEKIPLDGVIIEGTSILDMSMLTGEALPVSVAVDSKVLSGSINKEGILRIKVTTSFKQSTVSKILDLIENATNKKSKSEAFITKFSRFYTPFVVSLAVFTAIVPSIITGDWHHWVYSSMVFLVISCPCALVISVPLGFFAGLGATAHKNVLIKGSNYLEELAHLETVVLDKTGTITEGQFGITQIIEVNADKETILKYATSLEQSSNHPIAKSITQAYHDETFEITELKEISGEGMVAQIQEDTVLVGNEKLLAHYNIQHEAPKAIGSIVYVAKNNELLGTIIVADKIKEDSKEAIKRLKAQGVKKVVMLTGDRKEVAEQIAKEIGIDDYYAELLPQDKVEKLEVILEDKKGNVAFVGDGINDAPVLARADIGIAMGGVGSDAAIEAADMVLMTDKLSSISDAIQVSKVTRRIISQNIIFALGVKAIVMILSLVGIANMWLAIFADVGVALIAVLNSIRVLGKQLGYIQKMLFTK